jgi:hypothetical protein
VSRSALRTGTAIEREFPVSCRPVGDAHEFERLVCEMAFVIARGEARLFDEMVLWQHIELHRRRVGSCEAERGV